MNYGEVTERLKMESAKLYDYCGALRDVANEPEKEHWNNLRGLFQKVWNEFRELERVQYQGSRSNMILQGEYFKPLNR